MAEVGVVVGSFESEALLPDCIESLRRQTLAPVELIVVDAGSRDRSAAVASELGAHVIVTKNGGLGHLYNSGARVSHAEFVLLANPDTAFDERCLEHLAAALVIDEDRFAADPRQLDWDGRSVIHARTVVRRGSIRDSLPWLRVDGCVPGSGVVTTASANAGAMLVRRAHLLELGGFDEKYFLEYEDLDLCWRAWLRGWGSVYVADAVVRHRVGGATPPEYRARRIRASHASTLRLALKLLPAGPAARVVCGELLRSVRHPRFVLPALIGTLRAVPALLRERRQLGGGLYERLRAAQTLE